MFFPFLVLSCSGGYSDLAACIKERIKKLTYRSNSNVYESPMDGKICKPLLVKFPQWKPLRFDYYWLNELVYASCFAQSSETHHQCHYAFTAIVNQMRLTTNASPRFRVLLSLVNSFLVALSTFLSSKGLQKEVFRRWLTCASRRRRLQWKCGLELFRRNVERNLMPKPSNVYCGYSTWNLLYSRSSYSLDGRMLKGWHLLSHVILLVKTISSLMLNMFRAPPPPTEHTLSSNRV